MTDHDYKETAQFLKQYVLRYADVYFLNFPELQKTGQAVQDMRAVLAYAYHGAETLLSAAARECFWLIGTADCHWCEQAQQDYVLATEAYALPPLLVLDVMDFESTLMALLAPNIPVLLGFDDLLVCPFGLLDIVALKENA